MAQITLKVGNTGETIPVNELELDQVTNSELIAQLVANGLVPEVPGKVYKMIGDNNQPVEDVATLAALGVQDGATVTVVAKPEGAAQISLKVSNTGEVIPVNDIELDQVTNSELIEQLVANGLVPEVPGKVYKMIGDNNQPVEDVATLAALGVQDGATVTVVAKPEGAAQISLKVSNTGEVIPVNDIELDQVTNSELIEQLVANGLVPEVPGKTYKMISIENNQPVEEVATLATLGVKDGTLVNIVAKPAGAAQISLKVSNTGEVIPVNDIELDQVTNSELIEQLVANGLVPEVPGKTYKMISIENNQPVEEVATLAALGVKDGTLVNIVAKPAGAWK